MQLIITVVDEIANELNKGKYNSEVSRKLLETLNKNAVEMRPLYLKSSNSMLQKYFIVEVDSELTASLLLDEIFKSGAIISGYVKPKDEPPIKK